MAQVQEVLPMNSHCGMSFLYIARRRLIPPYRKVDPARAGNSVYRGWVVRDLSQP